MTVRFNPGVRLKRGVGPGKRFGGASEGLLLVEGDRVFRTTASGGRKRVPITRFPARAERWRAVVEQIRHAPVTGPRRADVPYQGICGDR